MKKNIYSFGIIVIVALLAFVFVGCGEKDAYLKIINQHGTLTITEVGTNYNLAWSNLNIGPGQSQTLTIEDPSSYGSISFGIRLNDNSTKQTASSKTISSGETIELTFKANGVLE